MKLSLGRIVLVKGIESNGQSVQPAMINRVWGTGDTSETPQGANVTVFPDCAAPLFRGSVMVHETEELGDAANKASVDLGNKPVFAYWPPKL